MSKLTQIALAKFGDYNDNILVRERFWENGKTVETIGWLYHLCRLSSVPRMLSMGFFVLRMVRRVEEIQENLG